MQFDFVILGIGVLAFAAILLHRHYRAVASVAAGKKNDVAASQRRDVLRALKSMRQDPMRKDQES